MIDSVTDSSFEPDFAVLYMPPALLHGSVIGMFAKSVLRFLESGKVVHVNLFPLDNLRLPQNRVLLSVVASRFQALASGGGQGENTDGTSKRDTTNRPLTKIANVLGDLMFKNSRITDDNPRRGFVSSPPDACREEAEIPSCYIYNHETGQQPSSEEEKMTVNLEATVTVTSHSPQILYHPGMCCLISLSVVDKVGEGLHLREHRSGLT